MKTEKLVQYGFFFAVLCSLVFILQFANPADVSRFRADVRFSTSMQLYKQFGKIIDDSEPPIIGILTQGTTDKAYYNDYTMIAASYIRYIEAAGAKVVAVPYNLEESELERIYQNINGLLIPGGRTKLIILADKNETGPDAPLKMSKFAKAAEFFVRRAIEDFSKGVYFPIFGICLGQEAIALAINKDLKKTLTFLNLTSNKYQQSAGPLDPVVKQKAYKSRIFDSFTQNELEAFEKRAKFFYHHKFGVLQKTFDESEDLRKYIIPLTTMVDEGGDEYVTSFEMYNYPIYGVQFHPEKSSFEWSIKTDRSPETISITHKLGSNFINECRKNNHKIVDTNLMRNLSVYKHMMMGPKNGYSQLIYFSKERIRDIINDREPTTQYPPPLDLTKQAVQHQEVQMQTKTSSESESTKIVVRPVKKSFLQDLQNVVEKIEVLERKHTEELKKMEDDLQVIMQDQMDIMGQTKMVVEAHNLKQLFEIPESKEKEQKGRLKANRA